jgi:hypothetical protein
MRSDLAEYAEQQKDGIWSALRRKYKLPADVPPAERDRLDKAFGDALEACSSAAEVDDVLFRELPCYREEAEAFVRFLAACLPAMTVAWGGESPSHQPRKATAKVTRRRADSAFNEERQYRALAFVMDHCVKLVSVLSGQPEKLDDVPWTRLLPKWAATYPSDSPRSITPKALAMLVRRAQEEPDLLSRYVEERRSMWLRRSLPQAFLWAQLAPVLPRLRATEEDRASVNRHMSELAEQARVMEREVPDRVTKKAMRLVAERLEPRATQRQRPANRRRPD